MSTIAPETAAHRRVTRPAAPPTTPWSRRDTTHLAGVVLAALLTRFLGLTLPTAGGTPIFDEKHYVPQGWDMVRSWANPVLGGIESNPAYGLVVHPPLGKQLLALGEAVFGYTPLGWRVMTALFGSAVVALIFLLARRLTQSTALATVAGIIAVCDGVLLVSAKFGMLDIFQVVFVVAAAWTLAGDMRQMQQRYHDAPPASFMAPFGPRAGFRWWRFATGVLLGLSLAVKWSGLYYIAFFGLVSVFWELWLRHRYGIRRPVSGTLLHDVPPALASLVALPAALYLWSWRAWFASETAVYRHAAEDGTVAGSAWPWLSRLPDTVASWLYYHLSVLEFHGSLTSSGGHSHPWDSKPWAWLAAVRPILYYSATDLKCPLSSGSNCREMIFLFGTPAVWWLTVPVLGWAAWTWLARRDTRVIVPLVAFAAGFLPWLAAFDRQMYFFYATALVPFTIVLLAMAVGRVWASGRRGRTAAIVYLGLVVAMFVYFSPILYGMRIPDSYYQSLMWLPSWT